MKTALELRHNPTGPRVLVLPRLARTRLHLRPATLALLLALAAALGMLVGVLMPTLASATDYEVDDWNSGCAICAHADKPSGMQQLCHEVCERAVAMRRDRCVTELSECLQAATPRPPCPSPTAAPDGEYHEQSWLFRTDCAYIPDARKDCRPIAARCDRDLRDGATSCERACNPEPTPTVTPPTEACRTPEPRACFTRDGGLTWENSECWEWHGRRTTCEPCP